MLPCNNTAIAGASVIISRMSDADDLAQRYLALWTQYLTALLADPQAMETLKRWVSFTQQFSYPSSASAQRNQPPFPVWPPFFGPFGLQPTPPGSADAGAGGNGIAALERRVEELEHRLAALEHRPKPHSTRRRPRRGAL